MILFHHRAEIGCRGWNCTSIRAFKGRCPTIRRPGILWPARVTLPVQRIKSPLHHFNACRPKLVLAAGVAPALATISTSCLFCWTTRADEMGPPAGVDPAGLLYKSNLQAAAWRR